MNMKFAQKILMDLCQFGVEEFVVCPGARNAPFVKVLGESGSLIKHYHYEERAAGFWALGRIKKTGRPVAVVTTSGTAVSELLSPVIEAYYSGLPLVVLSADRPRSYRETGAPQSIKQVGIFSEYVSQCFDFANVNESEGFLFCNRRKPLHINVCFDEPLIDGEVEPVNRFENGSPGQDISLAPPSRNEIDSVKSFFSQSKNPLIITSGSFGSGELVEQILKSLNCLYYLEATSGLNQNNLIGENRIRGGEKALKKYFNEGLFDGVIRVGSVPTARFWRDLENNWENLPVLSVTDTGFSGLARKQEGIVGISSFVELISSQNIELSGDHSAKVLDKDSSYFESIKNCIAEHSHSEVGMLVALSQLMESSDYLFLGNSLPIREWDFVSSIKETPIYTLANRGANGIDGLISSFLGAAREDQENWCVLGDLSALYDLSSFHLVQKAKIKSANIVIVNNSGGKIFSQLFDDQNFENRHELSFEGAAKMFNLGYVKVTKNGDLELVGKNRKQIIEIFPGENSSSSFWTNLKGIYR